jgi:CTP:phosphocholine cytidylyltransferase-like protein
MADNGYSHDNKVIHEAFQAGKILQIKQGEHFITRRLKEYINDLIINDEVKRMSLGKDSWDYHTSWSRMHRVTNKINQLRMKHWYWDKIIL